MFWFPLAMLALEAGEVIARRVPKIGIDQAETRLMMTEKVSVGFDVFAILARGGTCDQVIEHYRQAIATNALRLK
ncbi:hypothetical protein [Rhodoplanes sp. Z2-YC6860]|uniref:hypothetical protein n=1 Tax=Rhodoplanes sp. Z2-YC6860 TaxID=674703 RepID=UPI00083715F9|nr:hypothetical protein [Rhodoplanes sp. Z2-YC6860]